MSSSIAVEVVKYEQFEALMNGKPPSVTLVQPTAPELAWPLRPPRHLKSAGRALWAGIVMQYRVRDAAGLVLVTTAAEALDRIREAQAAIRKHGALVADRYGALKQNPACFLERDARAGMLSALRALNLDLEPLRDRGRSTVFDRK
jgi:phage terminase small subunit